ncbi:MAG: hypothetical protein CMH61_00190 [Nanoarchaeota archaeon]|nr:hypothetical protein [Nanoarchaeota archaeon]
MNSLLFGTAGIPHSTNPRNMLNGIKTVRDLGLDAMEVEFVRSVHISEEKAPGIKEQAKKHNIKLTSHGQYYVNLNSQDQAKMDASVKRILEASRIAEQSGVWSICYHMAYYMKQDPAKVYEKVREQVQNIIKVYKDEGIKLWLRPETGGKLTQWGNLREIIKLSQDCEQVLPTIDWAHHHARSNGQFNTPEEFRMILTELEKGLGRHVLDNMHMHIEGIAYSEKGERNHLNLEDSDFNYKDLMKVFKEFNIKGMAICESPNIEEDARLLQQTFNRL